MLNERTQRGYGSKRWLGFARVGWAVTLLYLIGSCATAPSSPRSEPRFMRAMNVSVEAERRLFVDAHAFPQVTFDTGVGFAVYDSQTDRILRSHNLDRSYNLASVTKLFTLAAISRSYEALTLRERREIAYMLRASRNRLASTWMQLAYLRATQSEANHDAVLARTRACYDDDGNAARSAQQIEAERRAAAYFFDAHRRAYPSVPWAGAGLVDGAGCERRQTANTGIGDALSARQVLTVLDVLRDRDVGDWAMTQILPHRHPTTGARLDQHGKINRNDCHPDRRCDAYDGTSIAYKTGTDAAGIKTIAGFIPSGDNPYRYYFVLLINADGAAGDSTGIRDGEEVVGDFVALWAREVTEGD